LIFHQRRESVQANRRRNQQQQISQRGLHSQLTTDDVSEATALERLAVQGVNVIKREQAEAK
jgi:hypothetical protein